MLERYSLRLPYAVCGGDDAMEQITDTLKTNGAKKAAIFTDERIEKADLFALSEAAVKAFGVDYYVLDELLAEPSYEVVQKLVDEFKRLGTDFVVACDGGSVVDAAKLASVLMADGYGVKELLNTLGMAEKYVPTILIPATAGAGAEVTLDAIVAIPEWEFEVGIVNENMTAGHMIPDARMIKDLSRPIVVATGVDTLAHCIECFTDNKTNPFSDIYMLEGLGLILDNIEKVCDSLEAMERRDRMQITAYYGGPVITIFDTMAIHALSYPLGGRYHIVYDVSNAILLVPVMRLNNKDPEVKKRLVFVYDHCCHEEKNCGTVEEKCVWMVRRIEEIVEHLGIPKSLKSFGVPEEDLEDPM